MAIFKAITGTSGGIGYATPQKLEDYLKYETNARGKIQLDEFGEPVKRSEHVTAINATSDMFSEDCRMIGARFNTCNKFLSLKYKHYVQGFPPEDNELMTRDKCHALGVELANTVWPDFPVLVVSHFEQAVDGTEHYHWHNHFIVYNCAVTDGHKIDTKKDALNCQKRFVAMQAEGNGLTLRGLVLTPDGLIQGSMRRDKIDRAERYIEKRGRAKGEITFMTQKAELRLAISTAAAKTRTVDEFSEYLQSVYGVKTKFTRGAISYQHPDRTNEKNSWIRGNTLGEAYTKEGVINAINKQRNRTSDLLGSAEGRYERTAEYTERRNVPSSNEEATGRRPAISDDVAAERYERILARHRELLGASDENTERNVRKSDEQRRNDTFSRAGSSELKRDTNNGNANTDKSDKQQDSNRSGVKV